MAVGWVALFALSTAFPIVAAFTDVAAVSAVGALDVITAAITALTGFYLATRARSRIGDRENAVSFRVVQVAVYSIPVLLVLFFLGVSFNWTVLLIGVAWGAWLLITVLPAIVALAEA